MIAPRPSRCLAVVVLALLAVACGGPDYPQATLPQFDCRAPRAVVFEALVRRAEQLGYEHANVDPMSTQFAVYAHSLSNRRRPRRPQRPSRRRLERVTDNLLIVEVSDERVRVLAFGPNVVGDDHMHPEIATELETFAAALRETSDSLRSGGLSGIVSGAPTEPTDARGDDPSTAGGALADP
ncbi:MAG: hypothetical protein AB8I08_08685 [Sandaracinaceae bacterium]